MTWSCKECANLNKSRMEWSENKYCYRYGCDKRGAQGFICFWCRTDSELATGGCSDFTTDTQEQMSLF